MVTFTGNFRRSGGQKAKFEREQAEKSKSSGPPSAVQGAVAGAQAGSSSKSAESLQATLTEGLKASGVEGMGGGSGGGSGDFRTAEKVSAGFNTPNTDRFAGVRMTQAQIDDVISGRSKMGEGALKTAIITGQIEPIGFLESTRKEFEERIGLAGVLTGIGLNPGVIGSVVGTVGLTAVQILQKVGLVGTAATTKSTAAALAVNTATVAGTTNWMVKNGLSTTGASLAVGAIGSYPFAGFIKEEALQTLGFALKTARENNDAVGVEAAIALQKEILSPQQQSSLKNGVPYLNVLDSLDNFYEAARIKLAIDEKSWASQQLQIANGETESARWAREKEEEKVQEKLMIDYYNDERRKLLQFELDAREQQRDEDAAFWKEQAALQRRFEEEDRQAIADFWNAYRKERQKEIDNSRPSKLNFGLV